MRWTNYRIPPCRVSVSKNPFWITSSDFVQWEVGALSRRWLGLLTTHWTPTPPAPYNLFVSLGQGVRWRTTVGRPAPHTSQAPWGSRSTPPRRHLPGDHPRRRAPSSRVPRLPDPTILLTVDRGHPSCAGRYDRVITKPWFDDGSRLQSYCPILGALQNIQRADSSFGKGCSKKKECLFYGTLYLLCFVSEN